MIWVNWWILDDKWMRNIVQGMIIACKHYFGKSKPNRYFHILAYFLILHLRCERNFCQKIWLRDEKCYLRFFDHFDMNIDTKIRINCQLPSDHWRAISNSLFMNWSIFRLYATLFWQKLCQSFSRLLWNFPLRKIRNFILVWMCADHKSLERCWKCCTVMQLNLTRHDAE